MVHTYFILFTPKAFEIAPGYFVHAIRIAHIRGRLVVSTLR